MWFGSTDAIEDVFGSNDAMKDGFGCQRFCCMDCSTFNNEKKLRGCFRFVNMSRRRLSRRPPHLC
jgi:hypothetical protein